MVSNYIILLENFLLYSFDTIDMMKYGFNSHNYEAQLEFESTEKLPHDLDDVEFLRSYNLYHGN